MVQYYTHANLQGQLTHSPKLDSMTPQLLCLRQTSPFKKESTASFTFKVLHLGS